MHSYGGPWLDWNGQTDRKDFLELERDFREEFEESWALFHVETKEKALTAGPSRAKHDTTPSVT